MNLFEFGSVVQEEMSFTIFRIWSSGDPPVQWDGTINAILKEVIIGIIHVKLFEIWTSGSGGDVYGRTNDGRRPITIPHLEGSCELKR